MNTDRIHRFIKRSTSPPKPVVDLLKNTLIGTNGALYQLLDTEAKIHQLHQPHFLYMERNGKCIGNITICERNIQLNHHEFTGLYLRYFAFDTLFQGGKDQTKGQSNFHHYFNELFSCSNFNPQQPQKGKSMYWAYIDPQNLRSFNMNERFGFQTIGQFKTIAFSRLRPKKTNQLEVLKENDREEVLSYIKKFYKDFNFFSDTHLFDNNNYFVLRDESGKIIAGIQANPVHWKIKSLPGLTGKILIKAAPFIPGLRKLFNPKNHRFLACEGLFWKSGHENKVETLLSGVLNKTNHHSLLLWVDTKNEMLKPLSIKWGFIQKMKQDNLINIVAKFNHFDTSEIEAIKNKKKYLSGFDMT